MKRRKTKIMPPVPFIIHAVAEAYDDNPELKGWVNYHTHGLNELGLIELSIVCPDMYDARPPKIINKIGGMMANGEFFDPECTHTFYIGNTLYRIDLKETTCFEEDTIRIIISDKSNDGIDPESPYMLQYLDIFSEYENMEE